MKGDTVHSYRSFVLIPSRRCRAWLLDAGRRAKQLPGLSELPGHQTTSSVRHRVQVFRRRLLPEEVLHLREEVRLVLLGLWVLAPILTSPEGQYPGAYRDSHEVCGTSSTGETTSNLIRGESGIRGCVIDGELIVREVTERT